MKPRYPAPHPDIQDPKVLQHLNDLNRILSNKDQGPVINKTPYIITNGATLRNFDPSNCTLVQMADIMYTLLKDLQAAGIIGIKEP